jgi:hypothetical protein
MSTAPTATTTKPAGTKTEPGEGKEKKTRTAKPKKEGGVSRPRLPKFPDEHLITVLKPNSKTRTANTRFNVYQTGMSIKQYLDKCREMFQRTDGQTHADIRWDADKKFIHVGPTVVDVPAEPVPQAAA